MEWKGKRVDVAESSHKGYANGKEKRVYTRSGCVVCDGIGVAG